jgi:hypothetical protein
MNIYIYVYIYAHTIHIDSLLDLPRPLVWHLDPVQHCGRVEEPAGWISIVGTEES